MPWAAPLLGVCDCFASVALMRLDLVATMLCPRVCFQETSLIWTTFLPFARRTASYNTASKSSVINFRALNNAFCQWRQEDEHGRECQKTRRCHVSYIPNMLLFINWWYFDFNISGLFTLRWLDIDKKIADFVRVDEDVVVTTSRFQVAEGYLGVSPPGQAVALPTVEVHRETSSHSCIWTAPLWENTYTLIGVFLASYRNQYYGSSKH